jgi:hypothetical protein
MRKQLLTLALLAAALLSFAAPSRAQNVIDPHRGAAAGAGTPTAIPDIWEWWEPSRESYANNDPITNLNGQANNRDMGNVSGGKEPVFKTNQLNGLAVAEFTGQSIGPLGSDKGTFLQVPTMAALTASHVFFVIKATNDPSTNPQGQGGLSDNTPDATNPGTHFPYTSGEIYEGWGSSVRHDDIPTNPVTTLAQWNVYEVISTGSEFTLRLNGAQIATTATNTVGFNAGNFFLGTFLSSDGSWYSWSGQIAGVYQFSAKKTGADYTAMCSYLNTRFGLSC